MCVFRSVLFLFFVGGERLRGGGGARGCEIVCMCVWVCVYVCAHARMHRGSLDVEYQQHNSQLSRLTLREKWKRSENLPFTKSLNGSEHPMRHHFLKISRSRRCPQTQFSSSTAGFSNEMKLKSRLSTFSLIHIRCQRAFCFRFRSLLRWSKF